MARPMRLDIFLKQPDPGFCLQCQGLSLASVADTHPVCCQVSANHWPGDMPPQKSVRHETEIAGPTYAHTRELNLGFQHVERRNGRPQEGQKGLNRPRKAAFSCRIATQCVMRRLDR